MIWVLSSPGLQCFSGSIMLPLLGSGHAEIEPRLARRVVPFPLLQTLQHLRGLAGFSRGQQRLAQPQLRLRQRQLLRTAALRKCLHAEDIVTTLVSETSMDESTGRPVALFKQTEGGGVLARDLDPLLAPTGLEEQANPALVMLGNLLGRGSVGLGQFADPQLSLEMRRRQYAAADGHCPGLDVYWMTPKGQVWREAQKRTEPAKVASWATQGASAPRLVAGGVAFRSRGPVCFKCTR